MGAADTAIYLCQWVASGITEHFFSFDRGECTGAGGSVVGGTAFGYVER